MAYGTDEDLTLVRRHFDDNDLRDAVDAAPAGLLDEQSQIYWQTILGRDPVPPRPRRPFCRTQGEGSNEFDLKAGSWGEPGLAPLSAITPLSAV